MWTTDDPEKRSDIKRSSDIDQSEAFSPIFRSIENNLTQTTDSSSMTRALLSPGLPIYNPDLNADQFSTRRTPGPPSSNQDDYKFNFGSLGPGAFQHHLSFPRSLEVNSPDRLGIYEEADSTDSGINNDSTDSGINNVCSELLRMSESSDHSTKAMSYSSSFIKKFGMEDDLDSSSPYHSDGNLQRYFSDNEIPAILPQISQFLSNPLTNPTSAIDVSVSNNAHSTLGVFSATGTANAHSTGLSATSSTFIPKVAHSH